MLQASNGANKTILSRLEVYIRFFTGFVLVATVVAAGFIGRSLWSIAPLGAAFTVLYFLGKKAARDAWNVNGFHGILKALAPAYCVQTVVCGTFYLLGRGIGNLSGNKQTFAFSAFDLMLSGALLAFGLLTSVLLWFLEKKGAATIISINEQPETPQKSGYKLVFEPEPITLENFFTSAFYGHREQINTNNPDEADAPKALPKKAQTTEAMIKTAEERLGIIFPPTLKKLYERQNGGMVGSLWVAAVKYPSLDLEDWRGAFSHDYCYLTPLERLSTLYDSYLDYLEEEDIAQDASIPKDAKRYIILCQRYQDTTFLDYSNSSDNPRVGIVDFEGNDAKDVWFDSFDDFFMALKRGELE